MTKLLLIASEFPPQPGGIGIHAHHLAASLTKNNYAVTVLTDCRSALGEEEIIFDSEQAYQVKRIPRKNFILFTYLKRIHSALTLVKKNDTVLVSGKFSLWVGGVLSLVTSKKIVGVVHGSEVAMPSSFRKTFTGWCVRRLNSVIAVSTYTKSLIETWGLKRVEVIPNGFAIVAPVSAVVKHTEAIQLITVGNVTERKGQQNVIRAMPAILKRFPGAIYHVVGIPTEKEAALQLAKEMGVAASVIFHGKVSEAKKIELLQQATVFVMLSQATAQGDVEGFGIAVLEANALGLPAIGATNCGIEDAISQDVSGKLVAYNAPDAIVNGLEAILQKYEAYSQGAITWSYKFTWDVIVQKYIKVLQS
ncbi:glycosyltransferase family 4 protein [Rasiella sp. SM2506]|uniref:glycosyltransferase family 4 protein n=1 Tax=Rasiella sp. SM2506 TaxID=3423914 RepID=UPI003D7B1A35